MKRIILTLSIVVAAIAANAQNLSLGPTAGFGHSWISNQEGDGKFKASWNVGATLVYSSMNHWGFSADVKYSAEGVKREASSGGFTTESDVTANYIRVPLKAIYFFGKWGDVVRPKVFLGPSFGFLTGGSYETKVNGTTVDEGKTKDAVESFDFGLLGGAGLNFRLANRTWLNTDITYTHGLLDVNKGSGESMHNRNVQLNVGVTFGIGTVKKP